MAKINYVYLNDNAVEYDGWSDYKFTDEFKEKYCSKENNVYKINVSFGTFTGNATGNEYAIEEIGDRYNVLLGNATIDDLEYGNDVYVNLFIPETVKRINDLGCLNLNSGSHRVNTYETYLAGLPVLVIPETVDEIKDLAFNGFQMLNVEDPTKYDLNRIGAEYINAYTYSDDNVFYKNAEHTILYGFIPGYFNSSNWIVDNVLTIPDTITEIYSFTGEKKDMYSFMSTSLEKIIIPTTITSIGDKLSVRSDSTIIFSYNGTDYTAAGTGNNDSYADLNTILNTAGITTDGLLNIVQL